MKKAIPILLVLSFILITTAMAAEFSADVVTVMSGRKDIGKLYFKNPKLNRHEAMGMVGINKHPLMYQLFPDTKKYVVTDMEEVKKQNPMVAVENFEEWIEKNNMKRVGTETLQGFECGVYEGEVKFIPEQPAISMKFWYSEELEYPIKNESILAAPMGKVTSYIENIKIGKQPDSLFEVPSGYTKEENVQAAMGMGGFQPPTSDGRGKPPSQEEMDRMMKQMQEMMNKAPKQ